MTLPCRGTPRQAASPQAYAVWSSTRLGPWTPRGCQAERGSGRGAAMTTFRVWAPQAQRVAVEVDGDTLRLWRPHPERRHGGTPARPYRRGTPGSEGMSRRGYLP